MAPTHAEPPRPAWWPRTRRSRMARELRLGTQQVRRVAGRFVARPAAPFRGWVGAQGRRQSTVHRTSALMFEVRGRHPAPHWLDSSGAIPLVASVALLADAYSWHAGLVADGGAGCAAGDVCGFGVF